MPKQNLTVSRVVPSEPDPDFAYVSPEVAAAEAGQTVEHDLNLKD